MASLVIVESPAKAKTISRILDGGYAVEASYGHIRDLPEGANEIPAKVKKEPWARLGVNVERDFEPLYVVPDSKKKYVHRLKEALKAADEVILATDEDREGESISWHVVQVLKPKVPIRRIAFHEITAEAIREALDNPRDIDQSLVRAQESRRILDRLYGYLLSPVLWKKVRRGLSAGRVQSVAVRLCVMRERERREFSSATYWDAEAEFEVDRTRFTAKLARVGDARLANGQDFDPKTGRLKEDANVLWLESERAVRDLLDRLSRPWEVKRVESKPISQRPAPPFTTSSLQQEANRKLGFTAKRTMQLAQRLYEGIDLNGDRVGLITYMRTDSVTLAARALQDAERVIRKLYGKVYTDGPRIYKTKSANAQEAHEAIRPTEMSRTPESMKKLLDRDLLRLYELVWKRTIASQMSDAQVVRTTVEIAAPIEAGRAPRVGRAQGADRGGGAIRAGGGPHEAIFTATGKTIRFPGYLRAYVEGSDDPQAEIADTEILLPHLDERQRLDPLRVDPLSHETTPPARYTEASLVKKLEAEGIGRPSTYATIIDTIQARGYVVKQKNTLVPTFTAFAVMDLLERHFGEYVDIKFTARMEEQLDEIAVGGLDWKQHLRGFYHGHGRKDPGLEKRIAAEEPKIVYPSIRIGSHPESGEPVVARVGRWGAYVQLGEGNGNGDRKLASLPPEIAPADLTVEQAIALIEKKERGPRLVGRHPASDLPIYATHGRYGAYVQLGETPSDRKAPKPRRAAIPKDLTEESVTLAQAVKLLSLPRTLGTHPGSGEEVVAARGRFGPYVKCGSETRSLRGDDDVYTITLERALEVLAKPRESRGRSRAAKKILRELGTNGENGKVVQVLDGPYGPYVSDGTKNASLPEHLTPDEVSLDEALEVLAERGKEPRRRGRARKSA
jgi:DNA topoisomerase-1